jgi:hypothetical protein
MSSMDMDSRDGRSGDPKNRGRQRATRQLLDQGVTFRAISVYGRFCSLIPGLGVKLSNDRPCRAHCSLRGRGEPSA